MSTVPFPGDLSVNGDLRVGGSITPAKARDEVLAVAELQSFPVPLTSFRVWDNMAALLPTAGLTDDLGIIEGIFGTATPSLQTEDLLGLGATNNYARALVQLPWEYVNGSTINIRIVCGMISNVASVSATIDCEAYKLQVDPDDAIGADLVTPAAQDMNSKTFAAVDFVVSPSLMVGGDILDVRIVTAANDGGAVEVIAGITSVKLLCNVR